MAETWAYALCKTMMNPRRRTEWGREEARGFAGSVEVEGRSEGYHFLDLGHNWTKGHLK